MLLSRLIILSMKIDVDVCSLQAATVKLEVYDEIAKAEVDELTKKESVRGAQEQRQQKGEWSFALFF